MLSTTADRVTQHSPVAADKIADATRASIEFYREHPELIPDRLQALDREWDVERVLETNASSLMLVGLGLSFFVNRRFFVLPLTVSAFLLQHALQGWCPPLPILRRLGIRTQSEIEMERHALLSITGGSHILQ